MRTFHVCSVVAFSLANYCLAQGVAEKTDTPARGRTLMMVDDHDVLYRAGTQRVLTPLSRHSPDAVVAQSKPWELAIGWTSIYRDPQSGKYQLWYQAYAGTRAKEKRLECVVCYAESSDGVTFVKPELELHAFNNHRKTNIVLVGNGGYGDRYCNSVLVDEYEKDPARRYKMAYYDWAVDGDHEYAGLHVAFSPDGIHWTKHDKGPLYPTRYGGRGLPPRFADEGPYFELPQPGKPPRKTWAYPLSMADAVDVFYDPVRRKFAIYGKMWIDGPDGGAAWKHGLGRTESEDFLTWSKAEFLLAPDDRDKPDTEFHTSPVFYYNGRYLCLNQILDRKARGAIDIELMTSRNGTDWDRSFRDTFFLPRGEAGRFDSRAMFTNSTPVVLDDELRFYYGAYSLSPIGGVADSGDRKSGVGLATLPRDRFAGLRPVAQSAQATLRKPLSNIGQVTFKPLDLTGCTELLLNADASEGTIRVEVLDEDGYRLRGYSQDDVVAISGDSLRHQVAWKDKHLDQLSAGCYLLRVHLDNATLFAVSIR